MNSWIEISEERLEANFRTVAQAAGAETGVLAVVKANAYGHGAEVCSAALARAGAKWLGVSSAGEGARVRRVLDAAGFSGVGAPEILVMCAATGDDAADIVEHGLTPVMWSAAQVARLAGTGTRVHLEIETGMGRQGVHPGAPLDAALDAMRAAGVVLDGVLTHFSSSEIADAEMTQIQRRRFEQAVEQVRERGFAPRWIHAGSSSSVDNPVGDSRWLVDLGNAGGARAMIRCGIALYGYCLPLERSQKSVAGDASSARPGMTPRIRPALKPVMTWKTRVVDLREVAAGETVGYSATFTAQRPMQLALLPVGYSDGLRRELSGSNAGADANPGGWVMVQSRDGAYRRAAIVGRISMNLTTVDVSGIPDVRVDDEVILLGDGITADDHARLAGTISYEILCDVRPGELGCGHTGTMPSARKVG